MTHSQLDSVTLLAVPGLRCYRFRSAGRALTKPWLPFIATRAAEGPHHVGVRELSTSDDILFERRGTAGVVVLNRLHALNALTHGMLSALARQLDEWAIDPAVTRVIVTAADGRAFSTGGDLRGLYDLICAGRFDEALAFWRDEYRLNAAIKHYRKPYVAVVDGLMMGGGVGIAIHGSHRVAGDRFQFAMPEVGIGFFPDVGATWFLPRIPGELGTYCALTGERLGGDEAVEAGIATHRVSSARIPDLIEALCGAVAVDAVLGAFAEPAGQGLLRQPAIDHLFESDRAEDILAALDAASPGGDQDATFARATAAAIRAKSPLSLKIALAQVRRGGKLDFDECMRTEFRIVSRVVREHDFLEGIRAVIVDKDQMPRWRHESLDAVSEGEVDRHFAPLAVELDLP